MKRGNRGRGTKKSSSFLFLFKSSFVGSNPLLSLLSIISLSRGFRLSFKCLFRGFFNRKSPEREEDALHSARLLIRL